MDKKKLIKHLREANQHGLWRKDGYTSLTEYCIHKMGLDTSVSRELLIAAGLILTPENMKSSDPKIQKRIDALRTWRKAKAHERELSAYVILPNRTLLAIAKQNPRGKEQLEQIHGMGSERIKSYGSAILKCLGR